MHLKLVISPYDLTARSAAAVAACVLADRVVTLMPGPGKNLPRDPQALAKRGTPAFERLAQAWAWSGPLWRSGCIAPGMDGDTVADAVRAARAGIDRSPDMGPLASLLRRTDVDEGDDDDTTTAAAEGARFDAICRDLVTGGINPSVTVPLNAAVESFASSSGAPLVRGGTSSLTTRIEKASQRVVFRLSTNCITEGDASDIVALRAAIAESSRHFRAALANLLHSTRTGARQYEIAAGVGAADAARAEFESALEDRVETLRRSASFSGQRMKMARVTITGSLAEAGAGVRAARAAATALDRGGSMRIGGTIATPKSSPGSPIETATDLARGPMVVITIKPMGLNVKTETDA